MDWIDCTGFTPPNCSPACPNLASTPASATQLNSTVTKNTAWNRPLRDLWWNALCANKAPGQPPSSATRCSVLSGVRRRWRVAADLSPDVEQDGEHAQCGIGQRHRGRQFSAEPTRHQCGHAQHRRGFLRPSVATAALVRRPQADEAHVPRIPSAALVLALLPGNQLAHDRSRRSALERSDVNEYPLVAAVRRHEAETALVIPLGDASCVAHSVLPMVEEV